MRKITGSKKKPDQATTTVLGRSAATGRKVLKPATTATTAVTSEQTYEAVRSALEKKT